MKRFAASFLSIVCFLCLSNLAKADFTLELNASYNGTGHVNQGYWYKGTAANTPNSVLGGSGYVNATLGNSTVTSYQHMSQIGATYTSGNTSTNIFTYSVDVFNQPVVTTNPFTVAPNDIHGQFSTAVANEIGYLYLTGGLNSTGAPLYSSISSALGIHEANGFSSPYTPGNNDVPLSLQAAAKTNYGLMVNDSALQLAIWSLTNPSVNFATPQNPNHINNALNPDVVAAMNYDLQGAQYFVNHGGTVSGVYVLNGGSNGSVLYAGANACINTPEPSSFMLTGLGSVCILVWFGLKRRQLALAKSSLLTQLA